MATVDVVIEIDEDLKKLAEELFEDLGMSLSTAFTIFMNQAVREQRIPFTISSNLVEDAGSDTKKNVDLDQFVMPTTERAQDADTYVRMLRDADLIEDVPSNTDL
ncbi:MAG: type II toxin-antitoxin system RelB/DinJ family antitoxin [Lachnospiraceae bacterium]